MKRLLPSLALSAVVASAIAQERPVAEIAQMQRQLQQ